MKRLIDNSRQRGVRRLVGQVLLEKKPMWHLLRSHGFSRPVPVDDRVIRVELSLAETLCDSAQG